ncbi:MAG TPA: type III-B CRISPR module RAMP protein Cmr4 [Lentisphaeria bacterium]|nr:type III-B CRISPR module RAMP protein Cmr4 [Lentisphaerota bacterium]OQC14920.1 MAG: RAMP superfamily protein [Lentisphaerae bacterium ADurb.Bin082]HPY90075.1 type III-B CRISPR module RAMP protein Cmr4 [Lentisphaeria bacterium]HQC52453.1 type III-B CRISPR module RAMP protein Cmr4 [Lentisphaeria bacterium]HQL87670.1 type III-B CRISPR module RAMP protein Cmr4 [Lentisphaeria bacterium]
MQQQVLSILTRTPMHVGAGASVGVVDLPIIRERHTGYPVIPGSSLKGVLAALWNDKENLTKDNKRIKGSDLETLFGRDDFGSEGDDNNSQAGKLLVGEAKILAFPVRSAKNAFAWCTCPTVIYRLLRDLQSVASPKLPNDLKLPQLNADQCLAAEALCFTENGKKVILEEYCLQVVSNDVDPNLIAALEKMSEDPVWRKELGQHLVILSNEMFSYFVQNACEIAQHVKIDIDTNAAQGGALFNQENVPSETMFYALMTETKDKCLEKLAAKLQDNNHILQIGADATTGLGWCTVELITEKQ